MEELTHLLSTIGNGIVSIYKAFEFNFFGIVVNFWDIALWALIAGFIIHMILDITDL